MTVTQYIGARYVPLFDGEWDNTKVYEPLTVVQYQGASYTSRQAVPVGIDITNTEFWACTGNYNAQVEAYRQEVQSFDNRITSNTTTIADEETNRIAADVELDANIKAEELERVNAVADLQSNITTEETERIQADNDILSRIDSKADEKDYILIIGDSFTDKGSSQLTFWYEYLASRTKYKIMNKSVGGSSFTSSSNNFLSQLQAGINDPNFNRVDHIIVYGGVNDFTDSHASTATMVNTINAFYTAYNAIPNKPKIHMCFSNIGMTQRAAYDGFLQWYTTIMQNLHQTGQPGLVDNVIYWHCNMNEDCFQSDLLHPNQLGQNIIAGYMEQIINGTYTGVHRTQYYNDLTVGGNTFASRNTIHFDNGLVTLTVRLGELVTGINLTAGQVDQYVSLGSFCNGASNQLSLMIGSQDQNFASVWTFGRILYMSDATSQGKLGLTRLMANMGNKILYFNAYGSTDAMGLTHSIPADWQETFTSFPNGF